MRDAWIEVNLGAVQNNVRQMHKLVGYQTVLCPVIKANACGHGAVQMGHTLLKHGAKRLAVAMLSEAEELREGGITAPLLVLGHTPGTDAAALVQQEITATVSMYSQAEELSNAAKAAGKTAVAHVKIDAGMGRIGLRPSTEALQEIVHMKALPNIELEGIYMHPPLADTRHKIQAQNQLQAFLCFVEELRKNGVHIPLRHANNTAAALDVPGSRLEMVRTGCSSYGYYSSDEVSRDKLELHQAMSLKARISYLKTVPKGTPISYGGSYVTTSAHTLVATIPLGFGDGYWRSLAGKAQVLVLGQRVSIIGKITMDMMMADVSAVPDVRCGDEVVLIGQQGSGTIWADEVAGWADGYEFELMGGFMPRLPRRYVDVSVGRPPAEMYAPR